MSSGVLKILAEYELDSIVHLPKKLERLAPSDWLSLSNALDDYYASMSIPRPSSPGLTPLTFNFASLPGYMLPRISTHLLISDKVLLDDPLYDTVATLADWSVSQRPGLKFEYLLATKALLADAFENIAFYLRAKELIQEGKLLLYKQTELPTFAYTFQKAFPAFVLNDKRMRGILFGGQSPVTLLRGLFVVRLLTAKLLKMRGKAAIEYVGRSRRLTQAASKFWTTYPTLSSLSVFAISGGLQGFSTDFISPDYAYIFRRVLELAGRLNAELPSTDRLPLPAGFSLNYIQIPGLRNVPVERVLDVISEEPLAFETFRSSLNEKLLQVSAPPGSVEREKQILAISESIQSDVSDIALAYNEIRKSFSKKLASYIVLDSFAILVAGLSTMGQNLDALAITGSVLSGAALGTSIKELAKEWLDYRRERLKLKSRDSYFVWRVLPNRTKN